MAMDADMWLKAIGAVVAITGGILGIRVAVIKIADEHIKREAKALIAAKLDPVVAELRAVAAQLNNGIAEQVQSNTEKLDHLATGQAEMKGTLRTLSEVLFSARPNGRRSYDP